MTTYPKTLLIDAISSEKPLRPFQLSYFRARYMNRLHAEVLRLFKKCSKDDGLTKAELARRLNKRPEQITRWLAAPGNWTQETVSDLLLAMGYEPVVDSQRIASKRSNYFHPVAQQPIVTASSSSTATTTRFSILAAQQVTAL